MVLIDDIFESQYSTWYTFLPLGHAGFGLDVKDCFLGMYICGLWLWCIQLSGLPFSGDAGVVEPIEVLPRIDEGGNGFDTPSHTENVY